MSFFGVPVLATWKMTTEGEFVVSKINPLGAFKIIAPKPKLPLVLSIYVGPDNVVHAPPTVSAEIALPPVAGFNCDGLTVIRGLVLAVLLVSVTFVAVIVNVPLALNVFVKLRVPATKAAFAGTVADASLERIRMVSVAVLIRFQF